jgi:hypothetical protein
MHSLSVSLGASTDGSVGDSCCRCSVLEQWSHITLIQRRHSIFCLFLCVDVHRAGVCAGVSAGVCACTRTFTIALGLGPYKLLGPAQGMGSICGVHCTRA